jgi:hypothetical protein
MVLFSLFFIMFAEREMDRVQSAVVLAAWCSFTTLALRAAVHCIVDCDMDSHIQGPCGWRGRLVMLANERR